MPQELVYELLAGHLGLSPSEVDAMPSWSVDWLVTLILSRG